MTPPSPPDLSERVPALVARVERALADLDLPETPETLYAPVRYALAGGGKRLRPVVTLLAAEAFGGPEAAERVLPAALATEVFHTFTLVHDDIMDRAETRRGRAAVHVRWSEPDAILAGDLLMGLAYDLLDRADLPDGRAARAAFHRMVARLCEGQALDLAFETRADVSVGDYLGMIAGKTGALLELCLELGALAAGAGEAARAAMRTAGHALGRAFQIQDDLLDLTADAAAFGKTVGGDLVAGKRAFLLLRALELARGDERAWFARALDGGLPAADVPEARARMERLGVLGDTAAAVRTATQAGVDALGALPDGPAADALRVLALSLSARAT